jgi:chromosome segregation ATPase
VLYLAEIQKQTKGFMGGVETKLKLLACQRNDQSWSIINENEFFTTDNAGEFGEGSLIVVNLGTNRQIQGKPELASKRILGVLQGFSRLLEKTKTQEQEIEQWKESLTIQSEELSRREIEMENRLEQVEQMEEEFKEFEQQREEIDLAKAEAEKIRVEFEAKSQELEGAWAQLKGQQQNLEAQIQQSKILDESTAAQIKSQLEILSVATTSTNSVRGKLQLAFEAIENQQANNSQWQQLEERSQIQQKREELDRCQTQLSQDRQELDSLIPSVAESNRQLQAEQKSLEVKQELTQFLDSQIKIQGSMLQMLSGLDGDSDKSGQKLDLNALENIPLPTLETTVENLKQDLEKVARFVSDQEEELGWQCKAVEELEAKIAGAGEFERLTLEQELADEKEAKKMLDQTLVGQRRSLKERHNILLQHSRILKRRQGIIDFENIGSQIDLEPLQQSLTAQKAELEAKKTQINQEIAELEQKISKLQAELEQQTSRKEQLEREITKQQDIWQQLKIAVAELESNSNFYDSYLQPLQNTLNNFRQELSTIEDWMAANGEPSPDCAINEIDRIIQELTAN